MGIVWVIWGRFERWEFGFFLSALDKKDDTHMRSLFSESVMII